MQIQRMHAISSLGIALQSLFESVESVTPREFSYNPWHGCQRWSTGCKNCFIYTIDSIINVDTMKLHKNKDFYLPIAKNRAGNYKIPDGSIVWLCFSSDFLIEGADSWRSAVWEMIRARSRCTFIFFTKRIHRLDMCLPSDWGMGYENVIIGCSVETQKCADERLGIFLNLPIKRRYIIAAPLLQELHLEKYLQKDRIELVSAGGESGYRARACHYDWVLGLRLQCFEAEISFSFHQTGANFIKNGKVYRIPKKLQRKQAQKAGIDLDFFTDSKM